jgi:hypothetical protein
MLLYCWIKGRIIIPQKDQAGLAKGEAYFDAYRPSVGPEECRTCRDKRCDYGFNLPSLLKDLKLRQKVLDHLYDASIDDALLLVGLLPIRDYHIVPQKDFKGQVFSKPCFSRTVGVKLTKLDKKTQDAFIDYRHQHEELVDAIKSANKLPARVILERKENKGRLRMPPEDKPRFTHRKLTLKEKK